MGKKNQKGGLGRSIIKDRFSGKGLHRSNDTHLHTAELNDGYDWNRINLRSVTEENSLDEFLATAELAGTEFTAERLNIKFVSEESRAGLLSPEEETKIQQAQAQHRELLRIPRRPVWDKTTSAEELDQKERESFLEWRRQLAQLQEVDGIVMTPFERNLDFWRQLWRVIERSDVVVQIVDGRNPLLFRSEDLEKYVKEVDSTKLNMLLINKADYLSQAQREIWASYFDKAGLLVAFWSAALEKERAKEEAAEEARSQDCIEEEEDEDTSSEDEDVSSADSAADEDQSETQKDSTKELHSNDTAISENVGCVNCGSESGSSETNCDKNEQDNITQSEITEKVQRLNTSDTTEATQCICDTDPSDTSGMNSNNTTQLSAAGPSIQCTAPSSSSGESDNPTAECQPQSETRTVKNDPTVLTGLELISLFKSLHTGKKHTENVVTLGLVGYPNVGKSSTINALLQTKKVPVSATPGRTKHFQTLFVDESLLLCDCPGLVMPTFVNTKAEMVLNGILPIDQMREYVSPVALLATLIPRTTLEALYGIMIPKPREGEDELRPPTAHELLGTYGYMRGYMTHKGIPDFQRSARHVLKDFVTGKLLYCNPPPDADVDLFCPTPAPDKAVKERSHPQPAAVGSKAKNHPAFRSEVDQSFFEQTESKPGTKGVSGGVLYNRNEGLVQQHDSNVPSRPGSQSGSQQSLTGKPWKKHHNRGKKQKLRRIHSYLDA